jgi:hypothetical protein
MVNEIIMRREGIVMLLKNNSARLFENRNATHNATTHPSNDNASRTNPLIRLIPAEIVIMTGMTKSTQTIAANYLLTAAQRLFIT